MAEMPLWAIQYRPMAAGMEKAIYTENSGMNIIVRFMALVEASPEGCCFMVMRVSRI